MRWLLPAVVASALVELGLRTMTLPRLSCLLGVKLQLEPGTGEEQPRTASPCLLDARYRAARRVLQVWPWGGDGKCLRIALVAGCLLRRRRPNLHLGVAHVEGHTVAHAWLTIGGVVLDPTAQQYTPLVEGVG